MMMFWVFGLLGFAELFVVWLDIMGLRAACVCLGGGLLAGLLGGWWFCCLDGLRCMPLVVLVGFVVWGFSCCVC